MSFDAEILALAEQVLAENRAAGRMIATAESCTGGLVAGALTEIPGSSDVFDRGFVTYSYDAKTKLLGVGQDMLETFGAVSVAVAWAMAKGALERSQAGVSVAISGVAGPGGGSEKKPVGTVVFARAVRGQDPKDGHTEIVRFEDTGRSGIRRAAVLHALRLLRPEPSAD
jgi:nicotinamide-nucleotide amidase